MGLLPGCLFVMLTLHSGTSITCEVKSAFSYFTLGSAFCIVSLSWCLTDFKKYATVAHMGWQITTQYSGQGWLNPRCCAGYSTQSPFSHLQPLGCSVCQWKRGKEWMWQWMKEQRGYYDMNGHITLDQWVGSWPPKNYMMFKIIITDITNFLCFLLLAFAARLLIWQVPPFTRPSVQYASGF